MADKKRKNKKSKKQSSPKPENRYIGTVVRVVLGLFFTALTIYTVYALLSYLFTWDTDQSLAFNPAFASTEVEAANGGGKLGWSWANLLVSRLFGLGAFVLPVFFVALAVYCFRIKKVNLLRIFIMTLLGAIIFSVLCDYIFSFTALSSILGGAVGGAYGHFADEWLCLMLGKAGTGLVLAVAVFIFACLLTPKVALAFDRLVFGLSQKAASGSPEAAEELPEEEVPAEEAFLPEDEPLPEEDLKAEDDIELIIEDELPEELPVAPAPEVEMVESPCEPEDVPLTVEPLDPIDALSDDEWRNLYDPRLDLPNFKTPPVSLLEDYQDKIFSVSRDELEKNKQRIVNALDSFRIKVVGISAKMGPTVTLYKIHLADGIKVSQVRNLEEDIAISLGAKGVRVVTLLDSVGIEVANERPSVVPLKAILNTQKFKELTMELPLALGTTVANEPFYIDLAKMPHLLVAGATGTGKSVGLNAILASLLFTKHPSELKLVLVDPKKVELSLYEKIEKHYLAMLPDGDEAIITDTKKVVNTLKSLCIEMEDRYDLLKKADVRQLKAYNEKFLQRKLNPLNGHKFLPYIVVIIDEFADLLMTAGREVEEPIARLAQKARAVGIHLVIATQRPSTNVITGSIKANFISRISFKVGSSIDSKVVLDQTGANRLIGRGDMLVISPGTDLTRVQCALIDTPEIVRLVKFISDQRGYSGPFELPAYVDENDADGGLGDVDLHKRDSMFEECAKLIVQTQQGSTSMLQRKLGIGYARAGRIMDQLEIAGIVGPQEGSKARNVLITDFDTLDRLFQSLDHAS